MYWIPYLELMSKRPAALKYSGLFSQLPDNLQEYLNQCDYERKKQSLKLLSRMTMTTGFKAAIEAFEEGIQLGARDPDSIWAVYCRLTTGTLPDPEIELSNTVPELKKYTPDIQVYDELIVPGGLPL